MKGVTILLLLCCRFVAWSGSILIPMDGAQHNHLKAYGIAYFILHDQHQEMDWLLNYRGGSFLVVYSAAVESECRIRGVSYERLTDVAMNKILNDIASPSRNMNVVRMQTAPRVAVYSPKNDLLLDETDAVINVLDYAEIPYKIIYD